MIFKTIAEVRKYLAVNASFQIDIVKPALKRAEREYLMDILGTELYAILDTAFNSDQPSDMTTRLTKLLPYAQAVVANFGFMLHIPIGNIQISDRGIQVVIEENIKPAPLWAKEELQNTLKDSGYADLEALQFFLDENQDDYPEWVDSSAFDRAKELFINAASVFSNIYPIGNSWRTFVRLKPIIRSTEEDKIVSALGLEYFEELKEKFRDEDMNPDDKNVLRRLIKALVYYTVADACRLLPVDLSENGLFVKAYAGSGINRQENPASEQRIARLTDVTSRKADEYLQQLRDYMNSVASALVLPTYYHSDAYTPPSNANDDTNINSAGGGTYFIAT